MYKNHCIFNVVWGVSEVTGVLMKTSRPCMEYRGPWRGNADSWIGVQSPHKNFTFLSRSSSSPSSRSVVVTGGNHTERATVRLSASYMSTFLYNKSYKVGLSLICFIGRTEERLPTRTKPASPLCGRGRPLLALTNIRICQRPLSSSGSQGCRPPNR